MVVACFVYIYVKREEIKSFAVFLKKSTQLNLKTYLRLSTKPKQKCAFTHKSYGISKLDSIYILSKRNNTVFIEITRENKQAFLAILTFNNE